MKLRELKEEIDKLVDSHGNKRVFIGDLYVEGIKTITKVSLVTDKLADKEEEIVTIN